MLCIHSCVLDVTVNPCNVHDSVVFDGLYDRLIDKKTEIETIVANAGYKTSLIRKGYSITKGS